MTCAQAGGAERVGEGYQCGRLLRTLAERLEAIPRVALVPVQQAIASVDRSFHHAERVHPSIRGASVMAGLLAEAIEASP